MQAILNLCQAIRGVSHSQMHWEANVVRLAAVASFELKNLRLAASRPGADRDELLAQADRLAADIDRALKTHEGR